MTKEIEPNIYFIECGRYDINSWLVNLPEDSNGESPFQAVIVGTKYMIWFDNLDIEMLFKLTWFDEYTNEY